MRGEARGVYRDERERERRNGRVRVGKVKCIGRYERRKVVFWE